mgnify:CR=1 FL=1
MCGICGVFNLRNRKKIDVQHVENMLKKIKHRGPDGEQIYYRDEAVFGFTRLSFIDLEGGMQPIRNEDGTIVMACNGEVFNYLELREELAGKGHKFKTKTDVEVIIHLYEEYGLDCLTYLNGQFAIAIYNSNTKELLLVRDHMGIAPLFYTVIDDRLVFASEIKSILEYPGVERKLNIRAVDQLLTFPGIASPVTFFENIHALENGHALLANDKGEIKNIEYWDVQYEQESEDKGEEYYVEELRQLMKESIRSRLIADVPIGFYISGGLDSSIVATFIHKYVPGEYSSFSAEFENEDYSERKYQRIIQECIGSEHHIVEIKEEDLWEKMRSVLYHSETPLKETYDVAAYLLSGLVSKTPIRAILTGQGADEFFNGYAGYRYDFIRAKQAGSMAPEDCEINERLWGDPYFQYEKKYSEFEQIKRKLYSGNLAAQLDSFSAINQSPIMYNKVKGLKSQRRRSYIDYKLRLVDHLLADHGDRMSFGHSIEGRHPFLDRNVIDFTVNIPEHYKLRGVKEKYILKKIAEGIVPSEVINRRKFPFSAPGMPEMLKKNVSIVNEFMSDSIIKKQGIFDVDYVNLLKERYMEDGFKLNIPYDSDYLIIVLTVTMFNEIFKVSS